MKASELRIGNLVIDGHDVEVVNYRMIEMLVKNQAEFDPIPLTEEWHNKFGVIKNGFDSFEYELPRKNNFNLKVIFTGDYVMIRQSSMDTSPMDDDIITVWNTDLTRRDMYVHEWQNLYVALTGEELTIKQNEIN